MTAEPRVVVIGGGVIGCAIARELAARGRGVLVLERAEPGRAASWAAAGMLSPQAEADEPGPFLELLLRSRALFPEFAAALLRDADVDVQYSDAGTLLVAFTEEEAAALQRRHRWQHAAGLAVEWLEADQARRLEPALSPAVVAAARFPGDHQVENRLLGTALARAAQRAGAEIRIGVEVEALAWRADRLQGVVLRGGERVAAGAVVVAAGCWAGSVQGLPRPLPVRPVHGQLLALRQGAAPLRHVVDSPRAYLVPRADGRLLVGATVEERGFQTEVTAGGLHALLAGALEAVPALAHAPLVESWAGLRPGTPDGLPILGRDPAAGNLFYATGHFRNGILLTPLTARAVADLIQGRDPEVDLAPFGVERFDRGLPNTPR